VSASIRYGAGIGDEVLLVLWKDPERLPVQLSFGPGADRFVGYEVKGDALWIYSEWGPPEATAVGTTVYPMADVLRVGHLRALNTRGFTHPVPPTADMRAQWRRAAGLLDSGP